MVNISITGTSSEGYRNVICFAVAGLPRRGGPASPWRVLLTTS